MNLAGVVADLADVHPQERGIFEWRFVDVASTPFRAVLLATTCPMSDREAENYAGGLAAAVIAEIAKRYPGQIPPVPTGFRFGVPSSGLLFEKPTLTPIEPLSGFQPN